MTVLVVMATSSAMAASPHFKRGGTPSCTFSTTTTSVDTATCTGGTLAGLGGGDVTFDLSGAGFATFTCTNPGGNQAAGQNKVPVSLSPESATISDTNIKN